MVKKVLKILVPIIIVLLLIFVINIIRNYQILKQIEKQNAEVENTIGNYYFEHTTQTEPNVYIEKVYVYNGIYTVKDYIGEKLYKVTWFDTNSGEAISVDDNNNFNRNINYSVFQRKYKEILLIKQDSKKETFQELLISNLFRPILIEEGKYIVKKNNDIIHVNKNTGIIEKQVSDRTTQTYQIEKDITSEQDVINPMENVETQ